MHFCSIWPIDRTISGATTPGHSAPGSNGIEGVLRIPQSPNITETSPSGCLVSYPGHSFAGWVPLCWDAVCVFYSPGQLGNTNLLFSRIYLGEVKFWDILHHIGISNTRWCFASDEIMHGEGVYSLRVPSERSNYWCPSVFWTAGVNVYRCATKIPCVS